MTRWIITAALVSAMGCIQFAVNPNADEAPGFDVCAIDLGLDRDYRFCPGDDWPWGEEVVGKLVGETGAFGGADEAELTYEFFANSGEVYAAHRYAFYGLAEARWSSFRQEDAPTVRVTVSAPCSDRDNHWFTVYPEDSDELLVAGGTASSFAVDDWEISTESTTARCDAPVACDCFDSCLPSPVTVTNGGSSLDLSAGERSDIAGHTVVIIEGYEGSGANVCDDGPARRQRWLISPPL